MRKLILTFIAVLACSMPGLAENWCEDLVNWLNADTNIDKTVNTRRNPETKKLESATYEYRFRSDAKYRDITTILSSHASEAEFFSQQGKKKRKTIVMRVNVDGTRWNFKLWPHSPLRFLVSVGDVAVSDQTNKNEFRSRKRSGKTQARSTANTQVQKAAQSQDDKALIEQNNKELEQAAGERRKRLGADYQQ